jgi:hypothetical protein
MCIGEYDAKVSGNYLSQGRLQKNYCGTVGIQWTARLMQAQSIGFLWFVLFIWLIWFIWLVSFNQKPDRPDKPNEQDSVYERCRFEPVMACLNTARRPK